MKKDRFGRAGTVILLLFAILFTAVPARADYIAAEHTKSTGSPYYIMVNRQMNVVTIYALGEDGCYSKPYKAMICSTARQGYQTPLGSFSLTAHKRLWTHMLDGSYGQYISQFKGDYLFHSVCYAKEDCSTLITEEYNMLGSPASMGCVRLQVADAKWIYENCPAGTGVTIYDSDDPGPFGKPQRMIEQISAELANGWEPTDPQEGNPWISMMPFTLRGSMNLRRAEIYANGTIIVSCVIACTQPGLVLTIPCGWYLDGEPVTGYQNNACRVTDTDRFSQITIKGERLGAGEHILEFRCNTSGLSYIEPYTMQAEVFVISDDVPLDVPEIQEAAS